MNQHPARPVRGERDMRILVAHSRYRSAAPSGENRVVDQETAALAALGHEVELFERRSDDIEGWPAVRKAALPAAVVWNGEARRDLRAVLRSRRPDVVHVHNTFPLLSASVLYACRDAGVPVVATLHNYKLACASGDFFRDGVVCHDCADGPARRRPAARLLPGLAWPPPRRSRSRPWRTAGPGGPWWRPTRASRRRSVTCSAASGCPADRVFVRHNMIPARAARSGDPASRGRLRGPPRRRQGRAGADGRVGPLPGAPAQLPG